MFETSKPITVKSIGGLFSRGDGDTCPSDHLLEALNTKYDKGIESRHGFDLDTVVGFAIKRIMPYTRAGESTRYLILRNDGRLYDSSVSLVTEMLYIPTMTDFSMINHNNRAYITPHDGTEGLPNQFVYVYDGSYIRKALGAAPIAYSPPSNFTVTVGDAGGHVESGTHLFAIAYVYDSGFITKPGPPTWVRYDAVDSTHKLNFNNIPTGPTGVVARWILGSKAVVTTQYDGNQLSQELFFVKKIEDNTTTNLLNHDFFDTALIDSADYLIDALEELPSCLKLFSYQNRLCAANFDGNNALIRVSKVNDPEAFDSVDGVIEVDKYSPGGVQNALEYRGQIIISKELSFYYTQDNGDVPSTWIVSSLDKGVATTVNGISTILDMEGTNADRFFVCDRSGLLLFTGVFNKPPLTYKVDNVWQRINWNAFNKVQIADDPIGQKIYIALPLDGATLPNYILYGDYTEGFGGDVPDHMTIKWSLWQMDKVPTSIFVDMVGNTPIFKYGSMGDGVYKLVPDRHNDNNLAYTSRARSALLTPIDLDYICHFNGIQVRVSGSGQLDLELKSIDGSNVQNPPFITMAAAPAKSYDRLINFVQENMSVQFSVDSINDYFEILHYTVFGQQLWTRRYEQS